MPIRGLLWRLLMVGLGAAFVAVSAWSLRYFGRYQPFADLTNGQMNAFSAPGLEVSDAMITGRQGGKRRWRVAARQITVSRDRRAITVSGITDARLFDAQERPLLSAQAGQASYEAPLFGLIFGASNVLRLTGGIHARALRPAGLTLQTDSLVCNLTLNQVSTVGQVTARLPRLTMSAGHAIYAAPIGSVPALGQAEALAGGTLSLDGGVRSQVQSRGGPATLTTGGLVWETGSGQARSIGPVSALLPGNFGTATAGDAQVDTRTGNLSLHHLHGTFQVSNEGQ